MGLAGTGLPVSEDADLWARKAKIRDEMTAENLYGFPKARFKERVTIPRPENAQHGVRLGARLMALARKVFWKLPKPACS